MSQAGEGGVAFGKIIWMFSPEWWGLVAKEMDKDLKSLAKSVENVAVSTLKSRSKELANAAVPALLGGIKTEVPKIVDAVIPELPRILKAAEPPLEDWAVNRLYPRVVRKIVDREVEKAKFKASFGVSRAAAGAGSILALSVVSYLVISKIKRRKSGKP